MEKNKVLLVEFTENLIQGSDCYLQYENIALS